MCYVNLFYLCTGKTDKIAKVFVKMTTTDDKDSFLQKTISVAELRDACIGQDGIMDKDEKAIYETIEAMDGDGDQKLTVMEIVKAAGGQLRLRQNIKKMKRVIGLLILLFIFLFSAAFVLVLAANEASKDYKPNSGGALEMVGASNQLTHFLQFCLVYPLAVHLPVYLLVCLLVHRCIFFTLFTACLVLTGLKEICCAAIWEDVAPIIPVLDCYRMLCWASQYVGPQSLPLPLPFLFPVLSPTPYPYPFVWPPCLSVIILP